MNPGSSPRRLGRSLVAILVGVVVVFVLSLGTDMVLHATGIFPAWGKPMSDSLFLLATVYRTVYTVAAGYITARLAPYRPKQHALLLGVVGLVLALAGALATWNRGPEFGPHWYPLALVVLAIPSCWAGGQLYGDSGIPA